MAQFTAVFADCKQVSRLSRRYFTENGTRFSDHATLQPVVPHDPAGPLRSDSAYDRWAAEKEIISFSNVPKWSHQEHPAVLPPPSPHLPIR